jgi:hypothetical protein
MEIMKRREFSLVQIMLVLLIFLPFNNTVTQAQANNSTQQQIRSTKTRLWNVTSVEELKAAVAALKKISKVDMKKFKFGEVSTYGGTIVLAPGVYKLDETIEFNSTPQVQIIGSGWNTIWQKVGNGDAIVFSNSSFCTVRNMKIIGDTEATSGSGIVFVGQGSSSCMVDYCRIRKFAESGIRFEGTAAFPQSSNNVCYCHFVGNRQDQLYSYNNNDFIFIGNTFGTHQRGQMDPNGPVPRTGVVLDHSSAGSYTLNYHWDNLVAFRMIDSNFNRIENNRFEESRQSAIIISTCNSPAPNAWNIIVGNHIHTNSKFNYGKFTAIIASNTIDTTFCQNQIFSWDYRTRITKRALELREGCRHWIIKNNIIQHTKEKPSIIYNEDGGHIVKDNFINE